ncbi:MAG TPA: hypothetical protein VNS08_06030 [Ureibacillus sp.]|nr:hypothetical protein [Ureibacillus sp.]
MNGKKVAIYFVGFIIMVCLLIVVIMEIFFATYEPKHINGEAALSIPYVLENNNTYLK